MKTVTRPYRFQPGDPAIVKLHKTDQPLRVTVLETLFPHWQGYRSDGRYEVDPALYLVETETGERWPAAESCMRKVAC